MAVVGLSILSFSLPISFDSRPAWSGHVFFLLVTTYHLLLRGADSGTWADLGWGYVGTWCMAVVCMHGLVRFGSELCDYVCLLFYFSIGGDGHGRFEGFPTCLGRSRLFRIRMNLMSSIRSCYFVAYSYYGDISEM